MGDEVIFALLHPEIAIQRQQRNQQIQSMQQSYKETHPAVHDIDTLHKIISEYIQMEKVTTITDAKTALNYMQDAIYYMTMYAYEAEKYPEDSDERWKLNGRIVQMTYCLSACAHYLSQNHMAFIQRAMGINWKSLARFIRLEQYYPFFLSQVDYGDRSKVIREALHGITLTGEFEVLCSACRQLQQSIDFRQDEALIINFSRLYGFFNDEYLAQYIEEAVKNWRDHVSFSYPVARLLRSVMIIGEAFRHASPVLRGFFPGEVIIKFIHVRDLLCHPERPANRIVIEQVLKDGKVLRVNGEELFLENFSEDILSMETCIIEHLQRYDFSVPPTTQDIIGYGDDVLWRNPVLDITNTVEQELNFSNIVARYEKEKAKVQDEILVKQLHEEMLRDLRIRLTRLSSISVEYMTSIIIDEIKDIELYIINEIYDSKLRALQVEFQTWVDKHDPHKGRKQQDLRTKLKDPKIAIDEMEQALIKNEERYEAAKYKSDHDFPLTKEEYKLLIDYVNVEFKRFHWIEYASRKAKLEEKKAQEEYLIKCKHQEANLRKTIALIKFCVEQIQHIKVLFSQLKDFQYVNSTARGYTSRGFGSHYDHHVLEFYQIMVGSCARALLENQYFLNVAPKEVIDIFHKTSKPSRGYLSHIGVRVEGQSLTESQDRAEVFYTNSKQIIEITPLLMNLIGILEDNTRSVSISKDSMTYEQTTIATRPGLDKEYCKPSIVSLPNSGGVTLGELPPVVAINGNSSRLKIM